MARKPKAVKGGRCRGSDLPTAQPGAANVVEHLHEAMSPTRSSATSPVKKTPRKAAARGKWSEEHLMTSDKSILIDQDLVKLLSSSAAWHCLEEAEQREILSLLPEDTHPNPEPDPDNPHGGLSPLPDSFVRYSNNWRDGIRQFQLDLQNGRYKPDWLSQAEEARIQRENGNFDSFKEREFEQFWGQKQKINWDVRAGESSRVSLGSLVNAGVVQVGDIWKFEHTYVAKGEERVFIEKEAQVHEITGSKLSFLVPGGRRVFLSSTPNPSQQEMTGSPRVDSQKDTKEDLPSKVEATHPDNQIQKDGDQLANDLESADSSQRQSCSDLIQSTDSERRIFKVEVPISKLIDGEYPELPDKYAQIPKPEFDPGVTKLDSDEVTSDKDSNIEIVISKSPSHNQKRALSQPATEPPLKRQRGRPRKTSASPSNLNSDSSSDLDFTKNESNLAVVLPAESKHHFDPSSSQSSIDGVVLVSSPKTAKNKNPMSLESILESENAQSSTATEEKAQAQPSSRSQAEVTQQEDTAREPFSSPLSSALSLIPSSPAGELKLENAEREPETDKDEPLADDEPHMQTEHEPENIIVSNIDTPAGLIGRIQEIDGRKAGVKISNAWKCLRCFRKNQDMGSLWDVRFAWFLKQKNTQSRSNEDSWN